MTTTELACGRCGATYSAETELSYCPCGAYAPLKPAPKPAAPTRVSLERAVELVFDLSRSFAEFAQAAENFNAAKRAGKVEARINGEVESDPAVVAKALMSWRANLVPQAVAVREALAKFMTRGDLGADVYRALVGEMAGLLPAQRHEDGHPGLVFEPGAISVTTNVPERTVNIYHQEPARGDLEIVSDPARPGKITLKRTPSKAP